MQQDSYRRAVLATLVALNVVNVADRLILGIVIEPIKAEFGLSDTQIGLLSGLSYALVYVSLGLVLARVADSRFRRDLLVACVAAWSLCTALAGLTMNYTQLLLARIGVAAGEAGFNPSAHAVIGDEFEADRRARALGWFALGGNIGILVGNMAGGYLAEAYGWRAAFLAVGLPGLALAVWARIILPIPKAAADPAAQPSLDAPQFAEPAGGYRALIAMPGMLMMALAAAMHMFVSYGIFAWLAPFYVRSHNMGLAETGALLGIILVVAGGAGILAGGWLSDRLTVRDTRWYAWLPAITVLASVPFSLLQYLLPSAAASLAAGAAVAALGSVYWAPLFAAVQWLAPPGGRARAAALEIFSQNLIGLGLGPTLVGVMSDSFSVSLGAAGGLRAALSLALIANVLSALFFLLAAPGIRKQAGITVRTQTS